MVGELGWDVVYVDGCRLIGFLWWRFVCGV